MTLHQLRHWPDDDVAFDEIRSAGVAFWECSRTTLWIRIIAGTGHGHATGFEPDTRRTRIEKTVRPRLPKC